MHAPVHVAGKHEIDAVAHKQGFHDLPECVPLLVLLNVRMVHGGVEVDNHERRGLAVHCGAAGVGVDGREGGGCRPGGRWAALGRALALAAAHAACTAACTMQCIRPA